jgi:cytochrome c
MVPAYFRAVFESSAILWSLHSGAAEQVLRFHDSAVNAVAILPDGRLVTGGEDGKVAIWQRGAAQPEQVFTGHTGPVIALAVSPDGKRVGSGSWDLTVRIWLVDGGPGVVLEGHRQNVNGVAFTPDNKSIVSVSHDPQLRIWPLGGGAPTVVPLAVPLNSVAIAREGEIIAGAADGKVRFFSPAGEQRAELAAAEMPVIRLAISGDGKLIAAAGIRGSVAIIDRASRSVLRTLVGPGLTVWAAAFLPDNHSLITGGSDRMVRVGMRPQVTPSGTSRSLAATIGWRRIRAIAVRRSIALASPATRFRQTKTTARAQACTASLGGRSRACPAIISPLR